MKEIEKYIDVFTTLKYGNEKKALKDFEEILMSSFYRRKENYLVELNLFKEKFAKLPYLHDEWDRANFKRLCEGLVEFAKKIVQDELKKVFIVHGRDTVMRDKLKNLLNDVNIQSVILENETNEGDTIIEKFIKKSEDCTYAIILMSPDDEGRLISTKGDLKKRARQNVILELGYFLGKLGRKQILILFTDDIEKPSDFDGFLHILYDNQGDWKYKVIQELTKQRFIIQ